jgi:hypothetical protein
VNFIACGKALRVHHSEFSGNETDLQASLAGVDTVMPGNESRGRSSWPENRGSASRRHFSLLSDHAPLVDVAISRCREFSVCCGALLAPDGELCHIFKRQT